MIAHTRKLESSLALGKELKCLLLPIRIELSVYDRLVKMSPDGDVAKLLKEAVERLLVGAQQ